MRMRVFKKATRAPRAPREPAPIQPNPDGAQCSVSDCTNCVAQYWYFGVGADRTRRWVCSTAKTATMKRTSGVTAHVRARASLSELGAKRFKPGMQLDGLAAPRTVTPAQVASCEQQPRLAPPPPVEAPTACEPEAPILVHGAVSWDLQGPQQHEPPPPEESDRHRLRDRPARGVARQPRAQRARTGRRLHSAPPA